MKLTSKYFFAALLVGLATPAISTPITENSPNGGALPAGVSVVGGIVADLIGSNGVRIVSQLAAAGLYSGSPSTVNTVIGTQTGFNSTLFGGGLASASFRVSLYDGDTAAGNFDFNQNSFAVDGINLGNSSLIATSITNSTGVLNSNTNGFPDDELATGWFAVGNANLASLFSAIGDGALVYTWVDLNPGDQFYNFSQGISSSLVNVGSGPTVVTPPTTSVPLPGSALLVGLGLLAASAFRKVSKR